MFNIKVNFQPDLEKLSGSFKKADLIKILRSLTNEIAFAVERYAKQVTPVRTGRLRSSIGVSSGFGLNISSFVQPNVKYAVYVHEGTRKMRARHFMKWGAELALQKLSKNDIAWRIDEELRRQLITL